MKNAIGLFAIVLGGYALYKFGFDIVLIMSVVLIACGASMLDSHSHLTNASTPTNGERRESKDDQP